MDYNVLFVGEVCSVLLYCSVWVEGFLEVEVWVFLSEYGILIGEGLVDYFGLLLLVVFWLEDYVVEDQSEMLEFLFVDYILLWCGMMLGKVEVYVYMLFWCIMVLLICDVIVVMWDEFQEEDE